MLIRDRIRELRRVPARKLLPHPANWRLHPPLQQAALEALLAEVGYAGALLAREREDGQLELIDGHLRAATTPDTDVPVLILDVDATDAKKLLATFDRLGSVAQADYDRLRSLLATVDFQSPACDALFEDLRQRAAEHAAHAATIDAAEAEVQSLYQVCVDCASEAEQRQVYDLVQLHGYSCRLVSS